MPAKTISRVVRPTFVILSVVGLAAAAHAQHIQIDIANPTLSPGESTVITLTASYPDGDYAMAGIATEIIARTARGGFSDLSLIAPMDGPGTSAGSVGPAGIQDIVAGQLNFPPAFIYADSTNPIAFWSMTFTASDFGRPLLDIETRTTRFDVYPEMGSARSESRLDGLTEGRAVINFPAPGTATMLGLGALALGRRRR